MIILVPFICNDGCSRQSCASTMCQNDWLCAAIVLACHVKYATAFARQSRLYLVVLMCSVYVKTKYDFLACLNL